MQPLVTRENSAEEYVAWATDRGLLNGRGYGYFNIGRIDRKEERSLELKYRLTTHAPAVARPAYFPPDPKVTGDSGLILAAAGDGFVYAIREKDGDTLWKFSTGEPIIEAPTVIENRLYVATQLGGLYCLDVTTGNDLWWAPTCASSSPPARRGCTWSTASVASLCSTPKTAPCSTRWTPRRFPSSW